MDPVCNTNDVSQYAAISPLSATTQGSRAPPPPRAQIFPSL
jgi:hypothetical protein